jgi:hypothetical protein
LMSTFIGIPKVYFLNAEVAKDSQRAQKKTKKKSK